MPPLSLVMLLLLVVLLGCPVCPCLGLSVQSHQQMEMHDDEFRVERVLGKRRRKGSKEEVPVSMDGWCPSVLECQEDGVCGCAVGKRSVKANKWLYFGPLIVQPGGEVEVGMEVLRGSPSAFVSFGMDQSEVVPVPGNGVVQIPMTNSMAFVAIRGGRGKNDFNLEIRYTQHDERCAVDGSCPGSPGPAPANCAKEKPNILIIYTDDQGYGDWNLTGGDLGINTPHINGLAKNGVAFLNGHAAASICSPSRLAIVTGMLPHRNYKALLAGAEEPPTLIGGARATLASMLSENGYYTKMIGKWHLGLTVTGSPGRQRDWSQPILDGPVDNGFDSFFGIAASMNYGILTYIEDRHVKEEPIEWTKKDVRPFSCPGGEPKICPSDFTFTHPYTVRKPKATKATPALEVAPSFHEQQVLRTLTEEALAFIQDRKTNAPSTPWFLYLALTAPHYPHVPADEFKESSKFNYGDFLNEIDARVGQVLGKLEEVKEEDNTLIIFSSDNGPEAIYTILEQDFGHIAAGGLRGGKRDIYEGGTRVPFFVQWKGKLPVREISEPVSQVDIFATLYEMVTGFTNTSAINFGEDSFSLWRTLCDVDFQDTRSGYPIVTEDFDGNLAIQHGDYKLIPSKDELYDLSADKAETRNLYYSSPDVVENMMAKYLVVTMKGYTRR